MAIIHNLIARFRAETGTFDRNINKSRTQMTRFGEDVQRMGKQLLAVAGIGGGLYAVQRAFKATIKAASDLQETQSKFNVVFRQLADEANKWAVNFGNSVGRSELAVKGWLASLQDTFVPLGYTRKQAMELSKSLTELAVDVASFNNATDAEVIRDFTSALVGNHEAVRKYGIMISDNAMRQEAMAAGINKNFKQLTNLEKVQIRYNLIQKGTEDAQGDALRTAGSYANQVKRLEAAWMDLKVTIGEDVLPSATRVVEVFAQGIKEIQTLRENMKKPLAEKPTPPMTPPKSFWDIQSRVNPPKPDEMEQRRERVRIAIEKANQAMGVLIEQRKKANEIAAPYLQRVKEEIVLTGYVAEAREHAAQIIKLQNKLEEEGLKNTLAAKVKVQQLRNELEKLGKAQKLARIATDIGDAFASAFERMIFEAEKFRDVMRQVAREIGVSVFRNLVTQPIANQITMALGGTPATVGHSGGVFGQIGRKRNVPAMAFAGAQRFHSGLYPGEMPAIVQKGETILPKGANMSAPQIIINNNTGSNFRQDGAPMFDGRKWVVSIVADDLKTGGPLRKMIGNMR